MSTMSRALRIHRHLGALIVLASIVAASPAFAGGALEVCSPGVPFRWGGGGTNIPWNPDRGSLGPLSNAAAVGFVASAFSAWENVTTSSASYAQGAALGVDVDITNFFPFLFPAAPDGLSAIVFDNNGEIFNLLFGPGSGVLGFAGPEWLNPAGCQIIEGVAFLNGPAMASGAEALDIMVHEFGHYSNLAHTVVNGQLLLGDFTGPTPFDTFDFGLLSDIETMYPFYFGPGTGFSVPHKDDIGMLSTLYPAPSFAATTGRITGRILASNGTTPRTGFNVIARNLADPFNDAVSSISSDNTRDYSAGAPLVGVYTLRGLTPGAQYAIFVDGILQGGFSTPPAVLPGPEEFYSGASEGNNTATDPPSQFVAVSTIAGGNTAGINIIFNGFRANEALPLLDDSSVELSLPFPFWMCGQRYDAVIVNANGTVSFGDANPDFSESGGDFLFGPPQIAGSWDDLNPLGGGRVFFTQNPLQFTVTFEGVPERTGPFSGTGANTFSITLKRILSQIDVRYGALTMRDGLAGVSCGGAITSGFEQPTDLSARANDFRINLLFQPAVFEQFFAPTPTNPGSPNDLANLTLRYTPTTPYSDFWAEPNDTLRKAKRISLPFDSIPVARFTEISEDGDVDYFRFNARAGQVIVAEILSSTLDTTMGLFNRGTGALLAVDDDSGLGPLSRIRFTIPADGEYAIAVSTFPDFGFVAGGQGGAGRYVLSVAVDPLASTTP